jgi:NADH-quinone oxidoreductase subunit N
VTAHLASISKVASLAFFFRVLIFTGVIHNGVLKDVVFWIAILSMVVGSVLVVFERHLKRMLAYSSIVHVGYMLLGTFMGAFAVGVVFLYVLVYFAALILAFLVLNAISHDGKEPDVADDLVGLFDRQPILSVAFSVSLLSLIGIPLTAGFIGKFQIVLALAASSQSLLILMLMLSSLISLYAYVRILSHVWASSAQSKIPAKGGFASSLLSLTLLVVVIVLGVWPEPFFEPLHALTLSP